MEAAAVIADEQGPTLRVLVADDSNANRKLLTSLLATLGHVVIEAVNGPEAVAIFAAERPDLVLLDVMMPGMDGFEVCRRIKAIAADDFVPVVFVTSRDEQEALADCVAAGGDDFLMKPLSRVVVLSRVRAMQRIRRLYRATRRQAIIAQSRNELLNHDRDVASSLVGLIMARGAGSAPNIRSLRRASEVFHGDLVLTAVRPDGTQCTLVGDCTGHGISAAIAAMPVADVFYAMTAGGFSLGRTVTELNERLRTVLPLGVVVACCLVNYDQAHRRLEVWNGGLPDVLLLRAGWGSIARVPSTHLPLGAAEAAAGWGEPVVLPVQDGDHLLVCSDGVHEALSPDGSRFGERRAQELASRLSPSAVFDALAQALETHCGEAALVDDVTIVDVACTAESAPPPAAPGGGARVIPGWRSRIELSPSALRASEPIPALLAMLERVQPLGARRQLLVIVLSELLSNALDHGLLLLDSSLRRTPQGFVAYFAARRRRLEELRGGSIAIEVASVPGEDGVLRVHVEDTGPGFDHAAVLAELDQRRTEAAPSGRGLLLVRSLCRDLRFLGGGRIVEADFEL